MKKEGTRKLKIAVIISVISVLIAILSLLFSVYVGMKDIEYKETIKNIQLGSQEIQKNSLLFDESYKKIELTQKSIFELVGNCDEVNKYELDKNMGLLTNARDSLIKNDYNLVLSYLGVINTDKLCISESAVGKIYIEVAILSFVWGFLIISLIMVLRKRNKK